MGRVFQTIGAPGGTDMPKTARSSRLTPAAIAASEKSEGHPLVMIALFSGIGLLLSLIAIIAAGSDASILP